MRPFNNEQDNSAKVCLIYEKKAYLCGNELLGVQLRVFSRNVLATNLNLIPTPL